jgi:hypothetical protein
MSLLSPQERMDSLPISPETRARTLLTMLWRRYDAAGISMGRGYEAVLLEATMELLGPADLDDVTRFEVEDDCLNDTRNYISATRAKQYGLL